MFYPDSGFFFPKERPRHSLGWRGGRSLALCAAAPLAAPIFNPFMTCQGRVAAFETAARQLSFHPAGLVGWLYVALLPSY